MEESIRIMKRMMLLLMAGLLAVCAAAAMAEEADADWTGEPIADATSAQEACAHGRKPARMNIQNRCTISTPRSIFRWTARVIW